MKIKPLTQTCVAPVATRMTDNGTLCVDFGRAAFGTLLVPPANSHPRDLLVVHLGEKLSETCRIDRNPPGTVRYIRLAQPCKTQRGPTRIIIPADKRNTGPAAIRMPSEIGEVYPFRYAEIENAIGIDPSSVRQIAVHYPFNDSASSFESSDTVLNSVWDLCKYSIKATSFCGIYVDGDRERIPYEGDAYINQLSHYCVDREYALARHTHEYLLRHPTWPTEWQLHSVLMAWADLMYTGDTTSIAAYYDDLCAKTLIDLARDDGLISTESEQCTRAFEERLHLYHSRYIFNHGLRDIVDWPPGSFTENGTGERDGHEMRPVNTVVNAFHYRALVIMSRIAAILGRAEDQDRFARQAARLQTAVNRLLFDRERGVFIDGEGSQHASLHSNMFAAAFGLIPSERRQSVVSFVKSRGMACSVYGSQYLLEAMYLNNESNYAFELITARHDRGWHHMLDAGSTITWEAWDHKYKHNLDWNHAWGAAPANIIPRFLMGIRPLEPGFRKTLIQPRPGPMKNARLTMPTPRGAVTASIDNRPGKPFVIEIDIPDSVTARVDLPLLGTNENTVIVDGKPRQATVDNEFLIIDSVEPGSHRLEMKRA